MSVLPREPDAPSAGDCAPAIRAEHVTVVFGGVRALDDVGFEVGAGEIHCLAGENGSGKSTLIKVVTGVYTPEPGARLEYFGEAQSSITPNAARDRGIAVIWQDLALFPEMTVAENIAFEGLAGNRLRLVRYKPIREAAARVLERLGVELDLGARLKSLPIAQRQLTAIARALISDARLIFMDEPTASLTQTETVSLLTVVRKLSKSGVAVVFVSHRLAEVLEISERVTVLRDGRLVGVYRTAGMTQSRLTELMTGKTFDNVIAARDTRNRPKVIEVEGLTRKGEYENVTLALCAGEIVGLTGLMGAGRTELGHTLFGMTQPDSGSIRIGGKALALRSNRDAVARRDRLRAGRSARAWPDSTAVDRRQSGHHRTQTNFPIERFDLGREEIRCRRTMAARPRHQNRAGGEPGGDLVGRQPAAGRARQMARHAAEGAHPRFARRSASTSGRGPASTESCMSWRRRALRSF